MCKDMTSARGCTMFKKLLRDASPKNPKYVLSRVMADFTAQSPTELTVCRGEEMFILFEINEWAFGTVFSDSSRQGYIPLDYCELITDFYEQQQQQQEKSISRSQCQRSNSFRKATPNRSRKQLYNELTYYESRHEQICNDTRVQKYRQVFTHGSCSPPLPDDTLHSDYGTLLYEEKTTSNKICELRSKADDVVVPSQVSCCCDTNRHHHSRSKQESYHNVTQYLRISNSSGEDDESGLGDSESVLSCDLPVLSINLGNDISTQTSQSLENLTHNIHRLSHRPQSLPPNSTANFSDFNGSKSTSPTFHLTSSDSPLPSVDSLLCESSPCDSPQKSIGYDSVDGDVRSFEREDFLTVKRRVMADDYDTSGDTLPCPKTDRCLEHSSEEPSSTHTMTSTSSADSEFVTKSPNVSASLSPASTTLSSAVSTVTTSPRQESSFSPQSPSLKDVLALPILEDGKKPNRVELTQLSSRIKEKLKPTRNELLSLRTDKKLVEPQSTETREDESNTESLSSHNDMDIKERGVTLQSIQEQYMKLEEARLLYNAIKQLDAVKINNC